jgi:dGTPase
VRRLADKTQVFPLEKNDSVRMRLTHSHEVANIARSIGRRVLRRKPSFFGPDKTLHEAVPTILETVSLAHDLGNPPFGHQGEKAIQSWFKDHSKSVFVAVRPGNSGRGNSEGVPTAHRTDFTKFEGNAQALRLVTRLQNVAGSHGLDFTAASLAALMKYPVSSDRTTSKSAATKKHGFFASEKPVVDWIHEETGLREGQRHPLTWIMEASDDIAYSVLDIEDAIKKCLVSPEDALAYLRGRFSRSDLGGLTNELEDDFARADKGGTLSRVREIKASYLRTRLIDRLIAGATATYIGSRETILNCHHTAPLLDSDTVETELCKALKKFALEHAYRSSSVLELELQGATVITDLMDRFWDAITNREQFVELNSRRNTPAAAYVYSLISDSYRWEFSRDRQLKRRTFHPLP